MQDKITSVQQRLINAVMQKHGGDDTAANKELGWGKSRFNNYRFNRRCADDDAIVDLARMAGEDPKQAVIEHRAEQAKTPQMRQFWLSFGKAAAAIMIAIGLSSALLPSDAFATPALTAKVDSLKIMRSRVIAEGNAVMSKESITYKSALELAIQSLADAAAQIDAVSWRWPKKWLNKHQRDQLQRAALLKAAAQKLQASIQKPR